MICLAAPVLRPLGYLALPGLMACSSTESAPKPEPAAQELPSETPQTEGEEASEALAEKDRAPTFPEKSMTPLHPKLEACLLYTSDAADE